MAPAPSQPIAAWMTPCNSCSVYDAGTSTRRQIMGLNAQESDRRPSDLAPVDNDLSRRCAGRPGEVPRRDRRRPHPRETGNRQRQGGGEFQCNQAVARQLFDELRNRDAIRAFVINEKGRDIALTERTNAADRREADVLISIHHDSVQPRYLSSWTYAGEKHHYNDHFRGYSLFCSSRNRLSGASLELGSALRAAGFVPTLRHAKEIEGESPELEECNNEQRIAGAVEPSRLHRVLA